MIDLLYTLDELRAVLRRSSHKTIVTEGRDDYTLFRSVQGRVGSGDCLPAGGKNNVLALHADLRSFSCPRVAFLVDADAWSVVGVPTGIAGAPEVVITDGYSIENDLLRDANVENLIDDVDFDSYRTDIWNVCEWYAAGLSAKLQGIDFSFDRKLGSILDLSTGALTSQSLLDIGMWPPDVAHLSRVRADYRRLLRGKTWLSVLKKYICSSGRPIQHNPMAIMDTGLRSGGQFSTRIIDELKNILQ